MSNALAMDEPPGGSAISAVSAVHRFSGPGGPVDPHHLDTATHDSQPRHTLSLPAAKDSEGRGGERYFREKVRSLAVLVLVLAPGLTVERVETAIVPRFHSEDLSRRNEQRLIADQSGSADVPDTQKSASGTHLALSEFSTARRNKHERQHQLRRQLHRQLQRRCAALGLAS
jgi:hypothetical protein